MIITFALRRSAFAGSLLVVLAFGVTVLHAQPNGPAKGTGNTAAHPQQQSSGPNALQGFSQNRDKPIKINAATLEVRDKDKMATFAGDVHLVQGDTTLYSKSLVVFYEDDQAPKPTKPAAGAAQATTQNQQIKRVEARGDVVVLQKDQKATGESGIFDMRANTVTLVGNVIISQGTNIVRGERLTVDMTTGVSTVECAKPPCRVQALLTPSSAKPEGHSQEPVPAPSPAPSREAPRQRSPQPSGPF
jgi:lipopolysaccharide export system protein LptA